MSVKKTCFHCKGEKTRQANQLVQCECGHVICESCLLLIVNKNRERLYTSDLIRCPVCDGMA